MTQLINISIGGLMLTAALAGCLSDGNAGSDSNADNTLGISVIDEGYYSGIISQRFEAISDDSTFNGLWLEHTYRISPAPQKPVIDFSQLKVIAVFLGQRPTGGYRIEVKEAKELGDSVAVRVHASLPGAACILSQATSQPFQILTIPRITKVIAFQTSVETVDCL